MGKQSLKKLSDDALLKRLAALRESVEEIGDEFDRERKRQYLASDKALEALRAMDLDEKMSPLEQETSEGLERIMAEMMKTAEEEYRALDRESETEAAQEE